MAIRYAQNCKLYLLSRLRVMSSPRPASKYRVDHVALLLCINTNLASVKYLLNFKLVLAAGRMESLKKISLHATIIAGCAILDPTKRQTIRK
jgi:hypothetical protein